MADRSDLVPLTNRAERLFLLDLLEGRPAVATGIDIAAFLAVTPKTLLPFLHWRARQAGLDLPDELRSVLAEHYRENALRQLRRIADLRRIDGALRSASVPYL